MSNMLSRLYAKALYRVTSDKEAKEKERCVENLIALLKKKGHLKLLPSIFREYTKLLALKRGVTTVTVSHATDKKARQEADETRRKYFHDSETRVEIDENIIGGFRVVSDTMMVDASYKTALFKLYRSMIS